MIFCLPSTLVLSRRKMNWKFDFSPLTRAVTELAMNSKEALLISEVESMVFLRFVAVTAHLAIDNRHVTKGYVHMMGTRLSA